MAKPEIEWIEGDIPGVFFRGLATHSDDRGNLTELYRKDELQLFAGRAIRPEMSYMSRTKPGVIRGPHVHAQQTDVFIFLGRFDVYLWLAQHQGVGEPVNLRYLVKSVDEVPCQVIIPPGVVHAYKNQGDADGMVLNFPNRLYRGWGGLGVIDEIRYENNPETIYAPWT